MDEQNEEGEEGKEESSSPPHYIQYTCTSKSLTTWCLIIHSTESGITFFTQLSVAELKGLLAAPQ